MSKGLLDVHISQKNYLLSVEKNTFFWPLAGGGGPGGQQEICGGGGGGDGGAAEEMDRDGADDGSFQGGGAEGTNRPPGPEEWLAMTRVQRKHWIKQGGRAR